MKDFIKMTNIMEMVHYIIIKEKKYMKAISVMGNIMALEQNILKKEFQKEKWFIKKENL